MKNQEVKKKKVSFWVMVVLLSLIFFFPLYYAFVNSLGSIYQQPSLFFKSIHFENYKYAVTLIPFFTYLKNSIIIVSIQVVMGVVLNFMYGYCFARLKARWKSVLFTITISTMMIPGFAISIPQYIMMSSLNIKDTFLIYVIFGLAGSSYTIFMFRQFLLTFPKEIEEAAIVDGDNYFSIIWHFYLPMCKPIIAVVFFNSFLGAWGDYMTPFMYLSESKYPLAIALFNAKYSMPGNPQLKMTSVVLAAALLFMIPTIVVFFICQKYLVSGTIEGSVKG